MQSSQCSPEVESSLTCFTYEQLKRIALKYNKSNEKADRIKLKSTKEQLWKEIYRKMKYKCQDEKCWVKNDRELQSVFRPSKPMEWNQKPRTWLSNFDIYEVMIQYEKKYPTFKFIGVFPSDYDTKTIMNTCVSDELCSLKSKELLLSRKYQLGIVFNTDPHYLSGSHWVAVYINIQANHPKFGFYFYDSNGQVPFERINRLYNTVKSQLRLMKISKDFKLFVNDIRHQYKNSECGMFSMYFLIKMLDRKITFQKFIRSKISDDDVFQLRNKYYSN